MESPAEAARKRSSDTAGKIGCGKFSSIPSVFAFSVISHVPLRKVEQAREVFYEMCLIFANVLAQHIQQHSYPTLPFLTCAMHCFQRADKTSLRKTYRRGKKVHLPHLFIQFSAGVNIRGEITPDTGGDTRECSRRAELV